MTAPFQKRDRFLYPEFDGDDFNPDEIELVERPGSEPIRIARRLSPFYVPQHATLEVDPADDKVKVTFDYVTDEEPEARARVVGINSAYAVIVGRYTKKILSVIL